MFFGGKDDLFFMLFFCRYALELKDARKFERAVKLSVGKELCPGYLRHKGLLFTPSWFKSNDITYNKVRFIFCDGQDE